MAAGPVQCIPLIDFQLFIDLEVLILLFAFVISMANDLLFLVADYVFKAIDALPVTAHPMTQFATGVMALQVEKCSDTLIYMWPTFCPLLS